MIVLETVNMDQYKTAHIQVAIQLGEQKRQGRWVTFMRELSLIWSMYQTKSIDSMLYWIIDRQKNFKGNIYSL